MNITDGTLPYRDLRLSDDDFANPRTSSGLAQAEIIETAASILKHGLLVPLLVRPGGLVIAGKRRYLSLGLLQRWAQGEDIDGLPVGCWPVSPWQSQDVTDLLERVPIRYVSLVMGDAIEYEALALVDNLFRSDLSSYEIAVALAKLSEDGKTGVAIAQMIGKSPAYVSRKLSCWRKAGPELRDAWRDGLPEDTVEAFAALPLESQEKALACPIPRGRRGPAHRPSVDAVRDFLIDLEAKPLGGEARDFAYRAGVVDALRWATGARVGPEFMRLAEPES